MKYYYYKVGSHPPSRTPRIDLGPLDLKPNSQAIRPPGHVQYD